MMVPAVQKSDIRPAGKQPKFIDNFLTADAAAAVDARSAT
jgi:hypothetical protein